MNALVGALPIIEMPAGLASAATEMANAIDALRGDRSRGRVDQTEFVATLTAVRPATGEEAGNSTGPFVEITLPWAEAKLKEMSRRGRETVKLEALEAYQRRSASLLIDSYPHSNIIKADNVIIHRGLGIQRGCFPGVAGCGSVKEQKGETFFENVVSLSVKDLDLARGDVTSWKPPQGQTAAKGVESWTKIFAACNEIRRAANRLSLSTIDSLLIRWAFLARVDITTKLLKYQAWEKQRNPQDAFDPERHDGPPYAAAIRAAMVGDRLDTQCWEDADERKLSHIGEVMGKVFVAN